MNNSNRLAVFFSCFLYTALMGIPVSGLADDTEIYTDSPSSTGIANILFNLDTSGSMGNRVDENNNGTIDSGERTRIEVLKDAMNTLLDSMPALNVGLMRYHYHGGPILFPVANLNLNACDIEGNCPVVSAGTTSGGTETANLSNDDGDAEEFDATTVVNVNTTLTVGLNPAGTACTSNTFTYSLAQQNDMMEEQTWNPSTHTGGGTLETGSSDMEMPREGGTQQLNAVWFRGVNIPDETATTTITNANIAFIIDAQPNGHDDPVDIDIYAVEPDDINVSNRQLDDNNYRPEQLYTTNNHRITSTKVDWDIAGSDDPDVGEPLVTADITPLIRAIQAHGSWPTSTQNMAFLFEQDSATQFTRTGTREIERGDSGSWPTLNITYQTCSSVSASNVRTGLLFQGVKIPQGVTIDDAKIEFTAAAADTGAPDFLIEIEDVDNAAPFSATPFSTARTYNATNVPWTTVLAVDPLTDWVTDSKYSTPDLKNMVQNIVNRAGWCGGNDMLFHIERTGGDNVKRSAHSFDGDPSKAPVLTVNYSGTRHASAVTGNPDFCSTSTIVRTVSASSDDAEEDTGGAMDLGSSDLELIQESTEQDVGIRFRDIPIAKNANIVSAKITFTVDEVSTGAMTLDFHGEDADDASTFSSGGAGTDDISDTTNRPRTTASVNWSPPDFSVVNAKHAVTGIEGIIQEIVDRPGWTPGNDLAILISGSGTTKRVAKSFDVDNGANAPILEITFQGDLVVTKQSVRERLKDIVDNLQQRSGTPIAGSMIEAARYFRGEEPVYGRQRGQQNSSRDDVTRISHFASYEANGAVVTTPSGCPGEDFNDSDCVTQVISGGTPRYKSPIIAECQTNYLINLTDGGGYFTGNNLNNSLGQNIDEEDLMAAFAAEDENGAPVTLGTCAGPTTLSDGTVYNDDNHNDCVVKLAKFLNDNDQVYTSSQTLQTGTAPVDGLQSVRTYTIGFNLCGTGNVTSQNALGEQVCCAIANHDSGTGICSAPISDPDSITVLKAMADVGDGEYFNANTAEELLAAFTSITSGIVQRQTSFVAPSIAANAFNRLFSRDEVYFGLFEPDKNTRWQGNVKKYAVCETSDPDGVPNNGDECTLGNVLDAAGNDAIVDDPSQADDGLFRTTATSDWTNPASSPDGRTITMGGAGGEITDYTTRTIYTDRDDAGFVANGTSLATDYELNSTNWDDADFDVIRDAVCAVNSTNTGTADGQNCRDRMFYMLGKDIFDEDADPTTDTRWWFHDVLHSSPEIITYGLDDGPDNIIGTADDEFIDKVMVATNDGGLKMINGLTGVEEWSFVPNAVFNIQQALYDNTGTTHTYGMDSTPVLRIIDVNGDGTIDPLHDDDGDGSFEAGEGDKVHVYITQRRGGDDVFALDLTPTAILTNNSTPIVPKLLWSIDGGVVGDFARMGDSWSEPRLARIQAGTTGTGNNEVPIFEDVLIFGGGYDNDNDDFDADGNYNFRTEAGSPNSGNAIYVVDADTGARIFWVSSDATADIVVPDMQYSIPSNVTILDTNGDNITDRVYVGDVGGQVWRLDIADNVDPGGASPAGSSVVGKLANISTPGTDTDTSGTVDPDEIEDERRFFFAPSVVQVVDTEFSDANNGEFDYVLIPSGYRAHPLDRTVKDRFYAFRDATIDPMIDASPIDGIADNYPQTITGGSRSSAAIINDASDTDLVNVSSSILTAAAKTKLGWYFDYNVAAGSPAVLTGEKGLAAPAVFAGTLIFTTFTPSDPSAIADTCSASEGSGNAYNFNILSANANLDWDGDGDIDIDDREYTLGSGIPSEAVPIFTKEGVTVLVGTGGGAENLGKVSGLPRYRTYWYEE